MENLINYMKDHIALTVVLAVVLVLIIALIVLLAVEIARSKKRAKTNGNAPAPAEEAAPEEPEEEKPLPETEAPATTQPEAAQEEPAPPAEAEATEQKAEPTKNEMAGYVFVPVKKDRAAEKAPATATKEEPMKQEKKTQPEKKVQPAAAPVAAKKPAKKESVGKWIIYEEDRGGYGFKLVASNGEVMIRSSSPYASLSSAKSGVKTYQENIAAGRLEVVETKKGNFFVQVNNASKRLLATSADYPTRSSCENALASIKRWAATTVVVVENPNQDDKK